MTVRAGQLRRWAMVGAALVILGGCAGTGANETTAFSFQLGADPFEQGVSLLRAGNTDAALDLLSDATARQPNDPKRQAMLGLAHQIGGEGNPEALELALVGYDNALTFEPSTFWPAALAGKAAFDRGHYDKSMDYFAQAVLADPRSPDAYIGLATAAYQAGDILLAREAARRAYALRPGEASAARLVALTEAATGDPIIAKQAANAYRLGGGSGAEALDARVDLLRRTAAADDYQDLSASPVDPRPLNQVSVDVSIVLSQNTMRDRVGMNLLDGLRLQYSADSQRLTTNLPGSGNQDSVTTLAQAISLPLLTYNLNLFNRFGQFYQVVARPSLTAYLQEPSEFFIGRTLQIGVRGIESGQIEQVDIGINLQVTPISIEDDRVTVRVATGRSFVTTDQAGTFAEALSTFRQTVSATAEVKFGETLVLSGLSESVRDATGSKVPVLGSVPVAGSLFNERSTTERRDAVLILLTPSRPVSFESGPWMRPDAVRKLTALWDTVIDPSTNGTDVVERLSRVRMFKRMREGDAPLMWPNASAQAGEAIADLLNLPG